MAGRIPHDGIIKCTNVGSPPLIFQPDRLRGMRGAVGGSSGAQDGPAPLIRMCWMRTSTVTLWSGRYIISRCFQPGRGCCCVQEPRGRSWIFRRPPQGRSHRDSDVIEPLSFLLGKPLAPQAREPAPLIAMSLVAMATTAVNATNVINARSVQFAGLNELDKKGIFFQFTLVLPLLRPHSSTSEAKPEIRHV